MSTVRCPRACPRVAKKSWGGMLHEVQLQKEERMYTCSPTPSFFGRRRGGAPAEVAQAAVPISPYPIQFPNLPLNAGAARATAPYAPTPHPPNNALGHPELMGSGEGHQPSASDPPKPSASDPPKPWPVVPP